MIQPVIFAINVQFGQIEAFQAYTNTYMEFLSNLSTVAIYETLSMCVIPTEIQEIRKYCDSSGSSCYF